VALIVYLARWLEKAGPRLASWRDGLLPFLLMLAVVVGLVMLEKDLGTSILMAFIAIAMFLVAGGRLRHLLALTGTAVGAVLLLIKLEPYRYSRMVAFANPGRTASTPDSNRSSRDGARLRRHIRVGLGQSVQKYQWLPEAHTDFIFAIIGEELGLSGRCSSWPCSAYWLIAVTGPRCAPPIDSGPAGRRDHFMAHLPSFRQHGSCDADPSHDGNPVALREFRRLVTDDLDGCRRTVVECLGPGGQTNGGTTCGS